MAPGICRIAGVAIFPGVPESVSSPALTAENTPTAWPNKPRLAKFVRLPGKIATPRIAAFERAIDLRVRRFIIVDMKRIAWSARYRLVRRVAVLSRAIVVALTLVAGSLSGMVSSVQAQLVSKQIPAYIPKLTTHASPFTAYAVAFLATVGVTVATFRSAHRGTRSGGREK